MSFSSFRRRAIMQNHNKIIGVITKENFEEVKLDLKEIKIELGPEIAHGQNCTVYKPEGLDALYARKNLCLKVFPHSDTVWGHPRGVGVSPIVETTMVQNLMALRGLAPRVYDLVKVNGLTAQVTYYQTGPQKKCPISDPRFQIDPVETRTDYNFAAGKLLDWQGSVFVDFKAYKESVIKKAIAGFTTRGSGGGPYQGNDYLTGFRDTAERLGRYNFSDFKDKTVLDIGCNLGMLGREALKLGAKRVCGVDWPQVCDIARELAILDGYFNIDFFGADIRDLTVSEITRKTGIEKFDIHLFLAMENWVGWPAFVKNCNRLYYEGHGAVRPFKVFDY
jgi:hypothetical protein